ncbi:MAG: EthD family reductase [Pseudonocardiaceae bacterium]
MIHQLIFAHPKPGMSEADFQTYWKTVHAPKYASKIPQIKRYMIDCRLPFGPERDDPLWSGVAEIWLENEEDQLASLQSPEFLEGARLDEPRWAAFWRTVVLDTDTHVLREGPPPSRDSHFVKLIALVKRKEGMPLGEFRRYSLDVHALLDLQLPGLRRYHQCHVRDSSYTVGEALLDAVSLLWFDDVEAVEEMLASTENKVAAADLDHFIEPRYSHVLLTDETWIIGPESR